VLGPSGASRRVWPIEAERLQLQTSVFVLEPNKLAGRSANASGLCVFRHGIGAGRQRFPAGKGMSAQHAITEIIPVFEMGSWTLNLKLNQARQPALRCLFNPETNVTSTQHG